MKHIPCAIRLRREGEDAVVEVETGPRDHPWVEVIRERVDGSFSHIVEPTTPPKP